MTELRGFCIMSENKVLFTPSGLLVSPMSVSNANLLPLSSSEYLQCAQESVCLSPKNGVHTSPSTEPIDLKNNVENSIISPESSQMCTVTQSLLNEVTNSASEQASSKVDSNSIMSGSSNTLSMQTVVCCCLKETHEDEYAEQTSSTQPSVDNYSTMNTFSDTLSKQTMASHCIKGTPDEDDQGSLTQPKVDSNSNMSGSSNALIEQTAASYCLKETLEEKYDEQTSSTQPMVENNSTVSAFSDTLSKQAIAAHPFKDTHKEDYTESILNAWASSILALSETSRKAKNKSNVAKLVETHEFQGITLTNKLQIKTYTPQIESFDSTKCDLHKLYQATPSGSCFEGKKEDLCEESDSEMEMPQLSPKDIGSKESSSCVKESETQNLTTDKQVKATQSTLELLEVVSSEGCNDLSTSDRDNEAGSKKDTPSLTEEIGKVSNWTDDMLQSSSTVCVLSHELANKHNLPLEIEEIYHNYTKACEHVKFQDSASTEPLAKRLKLDSEIVSTNSENVQEISYDQPPTICILESEHPLMNQEPLNNEVNIVDQCQDLFKSDTCSSEPYMEPTLVITQNDPTSTLLEIMSLDTKGILLAKCTVSPHEPFDNPDDGRDTVGQDLPTECARMHAVVPNLAKCAREFEQDSSSDDSDDDCDVSQTIQEPDVQDDDYLCQIQRPSPTNVCQTELPSSPISEHQIVPDEKFHNSSFSLSFSVC